METFHWRPQSNSTVSVNPRVTVTKFGDGNEERKPDGINNDLRSYNLTFVGLTENINLIGNFLTRHNAVKSFLWREPNTYKLIVVVCRSWSVTLDSGVKTITTTFEEVVR